MGNRVRLRGPAKQICRERRLQVRDARGFVGIPMGGMLPNAQPERGLIVFATRMIALGNFVHMAVGAMVAFRLRLAGDATLVEALCACSRPALVGNVPDHTVFVVAAGQRAGSTGNRLG